MNVVLYQNNVNLKLKRIRRAESKQWLESPKKSDVTESCRRLILSQNKRIILLAGNSVEGRQNALKTSLILLLTNILAKGY